MTREEILAMNPGREMDSHVAVHVMNLCVLDQVQGYGDGCVMSDKGMDEWMKHPMYGKTEDPDSLEPYSTDISAAWEVVEKMSDWDITIVKAGDYCEVSFGSQQSIVRKTVPEALCKAALISVLLRDSATGSTESAQAKPEADT